MKNALRITPTGNVGIGNLEIGNMGYGDPNHKTAPFVDLPAKLYVSGDIKATGDLMDGNGYTLRGVAEAQSSGGYTLPPAKADELGGVKKGNNVNIDVGGVLSIPQSVATTADVVFKKVTANLIGNASTVTNGVYTTDGVTVFSDVTSVGSGAIITASERYKLNGIEASADVTDATNVAAAGGVMNTGDESIEGAKTFRTTIVGSINGNAGTVTNGVYTTDSVTALADVTSVGSGDIITVSERSKLSGIEASADVTDATNVAAAGGVMNTGDESIEGAKTFRTTIVGSINGNAGTVTNGVYTTDSVTALADVTSVGSGDIITASERSKLSGIEASADVTDATNVAAAGGVMNTGDESIEGAKTFRTTIVGSINGNAGTVTNGVYTTDSVTALADVTSVGSGDIITVSERSKLSGIEASADVTDATNVAAAGGVMNTGDESIEGAKTFRTTIVGSINGNAGTVTNGVYTTDSVTALADVTSVGSGDIITASERYKLNGIEASADVTDATNVAAAGGVMNTGDESIEGAKTFRTTIVGSINGNAATASAAKTGSALATSIASILEYGDFEAYNAGGGGGGLVYDGAGKYTYTGPTSSDYRSQFSGGTGITYSESLGKFSIDVADGSQGQVLGLGANGQTDWVDQAAGGAIITASER